MRTMIKHDLPEGFHRLHIFPKKVKAQMGSIDGWDPKSRHLYRRSLRRYLSDPIRRAVYESFKAGLRQGELGRYENFSFISSKIKENPP